jgi:hypothetical protein
MWILLGGTFHTGGLVAGGPFETQIEAEGSMDAMKETYDLGTCPEFWCFELEKPAADLYCRGGGGVIVFDGDLTRPKWSFFGPFRDIKAARKWAKAYGGCALLLNRVPVKEPA